MRPEGEGERSGVARASRRMSSNDFPKAKGDPPLGTTSSWVLRATTSRPISWTRLIIETKQPSSSRCLAGSDDEVELAPPSSPTSSCTTPTTNPSTSFRTASDPNSEVMSSRTTSTSLSTPSDVLTKTSSPSDEMCFPVWKGSSRSALITATATLPAKLGSLDQISSLSEEGEEEAPSQSRSNSSSPRAYLSAQSSLLAPPVSREEAS